MVIVGASGSSYSHSCCSCCGVASMGLMYAGFGWSVRCAGLFVALQCCIGGLPCCLLVLLIVAMSCRYCAMSCFVFGASWRNMYCWRQLLSVRCRCCRSLSVV